MAFLEKHLLELSPAAYTAAVEKLPKTLRAKWRLKRREARKKS